MKCLSVNILKIIVVLLLLKVKLTCGIIGGFWKSVRNHPYLVLIVYQEPDVCCGSIIMTSWILTAAKCVHRGHVGSNGVMGVKIGVTNIDKDPGKFIRKKSIHIHPHFISDASYALSVNDIALIQLEKHLEFGPHVHPIGVAFQRVLHNTSCLTMGWGVINPNVYLSGQVKDEAYWPSEGHNSLRDVEQQTDGSLKECTRVMKNDFQGALHEDFHICALHYTFAYHPFADPTADPWVKPGRKKRKWKRRDYHHRYYKIRINTDGPSYYDYGAPLTCFGQQVGIFVFPVANVKMWRPAARAVYTLLLRYLTWVDTVIEFELNIEENEPPTKPEDNQHISIWDDLSSNDVLCCSKIIIGLMFIFVMILY